MRITFCLVGRLRAGPEKALTADYLDRFARVGRSQGFGIPEVIEVEAKRGGGSEEEAALLSRAIPGGALVCILDERGQQMSSPEFAARIAGWRDAGRDLAFVIGGADGLSPGLRARADAALSFGRMVWPHMLVRVMLAEQLYRAGQILAGTPYHRA